MSDTKPDHRKGERRKGSTRRRLDDRRPVRETTSMMDLFHRLWGEARDGIYVKSNWAEMQRELGRRQ